MPGGVSCGKQVGELAVGFKAVHCLEVKHLNDSEFFNIVTIIGTFITVEFSVKRTQNQEPEWVCGVGSSLREGPD